MSHESFHSENSNVVRKFLFCNHYPQDLIEKHIKIRIEQDKSRQNNVLSDNRKEYADHDFDWNNAEILQSENNKGKREFMEKLYIKREGAYSINLKTDLVKYNGCYDSMIGYI